MEGGNAPKSFPRSKIFGASKTKSFSCKSAEFKFNRKSCKKAVTFSKYNFFAKEVSFWNESIYLKPVNPFFNF